MDVLIAYAGAKNWVTAKAARPDINRAGNAGECAFRSRGCRMAVDGCHSETVLRALAEGRVRWAFWPPGTDLSMVGGAGDGIWISDGDDTVGVYSESDGEEEVEGDHGSESDEKDSQESDYPDEEGEEEEEAESNEASVGGRFGALALEDAASELSTEEE